MLTEVSIPITYINIHVHSTYIQAFQVTQCNFTQPVTTFSSNLTLGQLSSFVTRYRPHNNVGTFLFLVYIFVPLTVINNISLYRSVMLCKRLIKVQKLVQSLYAYTTTTSHDVQLIILTQCHMVSVTKSAVTTVS